MTTNVLILMLRGPATTFLKERKHSFRPLVDRGYKEFLGMLKYIPNANIVDTLLAEPNENLITNILFEKYNEADIVIITGYIQPAESTYANNAIRTIGDNLLPTRLKNFITRIETRWEDLTRYNITCGICNRTFFINLSGIYIYREKIRCFAIISNMLINISRLINEFRNRQQNNIALDDLEQEEDTDTDENFENSDDPSLARNNANDTELISLARAIEILNKVVESDEKIPETIKISDSHGRVSCQKVYSNNNVPSFRTSRKHGYAVVAADGLKSRKVQHRKTDCSSVPLENETCVWVNSGAPVPIGATAVVPVKNAKLVKDPADSSKTIKLRNKPLEGENIRTVGCELKKGKLIVNQFRPIGIEDMGLLAISGHKEINVAIRLPIGILSIGDNLEEPGEPLKPGFTYDINRITLISLLKHHGYSSSLDLGIVNNKVSSIQEKIEKALKEVKILVTTGCVNDRDLLKNILTEHFRANICFRNVNIKPGKSTTLATCKINNEIKYFLCLSGNPTSAFITAYIFLLPLVKKLHWDIYPEPVEIISQTETSYLLHRRPRLALTNLRWSNTENVAKASSISNFHSNRLRDIVNSNALLILPKRKQEENLPPNSIVTALIVDYPKKFDCQL